MQDGLSAWSRSAASNKLGLEINSFGVWLSRFMEFRKLVHEYLMESEDWSISKVDCGALLVIISSSRAQFNAMEPSSLTIWSLPAALSSSEFPESRIQNSELKHTHVSSLTPTQNSGISSTSGTLELVSKRIIEPAR